MGTRSGATPRQPEGGQRRGRDAWLDAGDAFVVPAVVTGRIRIQEGTRPMTITDAALSPAKSLDMTRHRSREFVSVTPPT